MGAVHNQYNALIAKGEVREDLAQVALITQLDQLLEHIQEKSLAQKSSPLGWLFGQRKKPRDVIKGLYVYGAVGRGKTMLMDLFFSCLPEENKRRAHFNDFMNDVQDRINTHRQALKQGKTQQSDSIISVGENLAKEAQILCFDEFTVTDIADAMILGRLFTVLFQHGVILVATSNVAPDDLYHNGLNRQLFLPFIQTLKEHIEIYNLDAPTDYRLEKSDRLPICMTPLNEETARSMDYAWQSVIHNEKEHSDEMDVRGHIVEIPRMAGNTARFDFYDLCTKPLGAFDYIALVKRFRTIFIDNVPILDDTRRNETKRFILLIDTLYDHHVRLFFSAAATVDKLYVGQSKTTETFEFERTASRLFEMQSEEYMTAWKDGDPRKL